MSLSDHRNNILLHLIFLWCSFLQIFVNGDLVYAQTWQAVADPGEGPWEPAPPPALSFGPRN